MEIQKDNKFHGKLHTKIVGIEGENKGKNFHQLGMLWKKSQIQRKSRRVEKQKIKNQQIEAVKKFTRVDFQQKRDGSGTTTKLS